MFESMYGVFYGTMTKLEADVLSFLRGEMKIAELVWTGNYANANSCANAYRNTVKQQGYSGSVKVRTRDNRVYLERI